MIWRLEGIREEAWNHTAMICCMMYNAWRGKGPLATAEDFHPYSKKAKKKRPMSKHEMLEAMKIARTILPDRLSEKEIWRRWNKWEQQQSEQSKQDKPTSRSERMSAH